jgi:putative addiction module antidote
MITLQVCKVGESMGVILPEEMLTQLEVKDGDKLIFLESTIGYRIVPYSEDFARQMETAEYGMEKYREALRELAKH